MTGLPLIGVAVRNMFALAAGTLQRIICRFLTAVKPVWSHSEQNIATVAPKHSTKRRLSWIVVKMLSG